MSVALPTLAYDRVVRISWNRHRSQNTDNRHPIINSMQGETALCLTCHHFHCPILKLLKVDECEHAFACVWHINVQRPCQLLGKLTLIQSIHTASLCDVGFTGTRDNFYGLRLRQPTPSAPPFRSGCAAFVSQSAGFVSSCLPKVITKNPATARPLAEVQHVLQQSQFLRGMVPPTVARHCVSQQTTVVMALDEKRL